MPPAKQITIANQTVNVEVVPHPVDPMARVFRASDDSGRTHEHTLTLGPVDGGVSQFTLAELQKLYDDERHKAASHVVFKARLSDLEAQVQ